MEKETRCLRCNRVIEQGKSIERGYGPTCYKKMIQERNQAIFERLQTTIYDYLTGKEQGS